MRKKSICLSERDLMFAIGGQLFDQAPNRQPRKAEIIMQKVRDAFRKDAHNDNEYYTLVIGEKEVEKYIKDMLFAIPEFQELNLTQIEFENNVSVDDENRPKFGFSSRYDKYNAESWKSDFIDLDAFVRNVTMNIWIVKDANTDCFCCVHKDNGNKDKCDICVVNPLYGVNYESCREPRGEFTFACQFDCFKSRYICCEECSDKDACPKKCDGESSSCDQAVNKK